MQVIVYVKFNKCPLLKRKIVHCSKEKNYGSKYKTEKNHARQLIIGKTGKIYIY